MVRLRTIRQRRSRARKGQVAAVATVMGLLLVVTYLSNYLEQQLPATLTATEFSHIIQLEDQMSALQATVLAESHSIAPGLALASPLTLGSAGAPPFGPPDSGVLHPEISGTQIVSSYSIGSWVSAPPQWNFGSSCISGGAGHCAGNGHVDTWNVTNANHSSFTITVNGNSNSMAYNISGNNDTVNVDWTGGDTGFIYMQINGSDDQVIYNKGGSDTTTPTASFLFFGQRDIFSFNPSGSHSAKGGMTVFVEFVGSLNLLCPFGNLSATDKVGTLAAGGSNLNLSVVWWNAIGHVSGPTKQTYPGGGASNETIWWSNRSGPVGCPFTKLSSTSYTTQDGSGIGVTVLNRYLPITTIAFDEGAVIEYQLGGNPLMVSPPDITFTPIQAGLAASITLVDVIQSFGSENGYGTAAVSTHLLQSSTFALQNGKTANSLTSLYLFNVTTPYPWAWTTYFDARGPIFPFGATCTTLKPIAAPYSCLHPPPNVLVRVSAPMSVVELTLTSITVAVSID
jgi:hypothetical protein